MLGNEAKVVLLNKTFRKTRQEIRKVQLLRNFKLYEVKDEHCNCTIQATHIYACIRGSRIPTMSRMSQDPQWEVGASLTLFYVPFGGQQTYLKIEQNVSQRKL